MSETHWIAQASEDRKNLYVAELPSGVRLNPPCERPEFELSSRIVGLLTESNMVPKGKGMHVLINNEKWEIWTLEISRFEEKCGKMFTVSA